MYMNLKGLICKAVMLLCMLGFFGVNESVQAYAEDNKVIDYDVFQKMIYLDQEDDVTYRIVPDKSGLYRVFWKTAVLDGDIEAACGGLYNSDMEFIGCVANDYVKATDANRFYLCKDKTYYLVIKKEATCEKLNVDFEIYYNNIDVDLNSIKDVDVVVGNEKIDLNSANIKGLSYDEKTHTIELNNYNGGDEIKITSHWFFEADEKDVPNFPNINIKITGVNNVVFAKKPMVLFDISGHGNFNIIGDGILNVDFCDDEVFSNKINMVIAGHESNITFDGPTLNVEMTDMPIINTCFGSINIGKFTMKSGSINIETFMNYYPEYHAAIVAGAIEMTGGRIYIKYEHNGYRELSETASAPAIVSFTDMNVTGGMIIITGAKEILDKNDPIIVAGTGVGDDIKNALLAGDRFDISRVNVKLEKDVYEYDGKAKTPKVNIEGLIEDKDFTVSYVDNIKVGTAKVTIKGIGLFTGSKEVTFKIVEGKDDKGSVDGVNGPKVGSKITDGKLIYKVTKVGSLDGKKVGKVTVVGLKKKSLKKVSIKSILRVNGVRYKVMAIGKKAFKKGKKLKSIVIGKNVTKIGKGAFAGCKKLKSIKIKSKKIKKFVKGTFKGVKKTCVIKVPKTKKKVYTKKIKKAGFKGKVK